MSALKSPLASNRRTIIWTFATYVAMSVTLFLALTALLLFPQISVTFTGLQNQSDRASSQTYASILNRYIKDREFALSDIAQSPYVYNAVLLAQGERADFKDFINYSSLLGEDPVLTVVDVNAEVLYSEDNDVNPHFWTKLILDGTVANLLSLENTDRDAQFRLAIPIIHGSGIEGAIIARFSANPDLIYSGLSNYSGVTFSKNSRVIRSDLSGIQFPHAETQHIEGYDLDVAHITSRSEVLKQRRLFITKFFITSLSVAVLAFTLLIIFGQKLIVKPFIDLASSQKAISKAVEGISLIDTNGRYVEVNNSFANNADYCPDELIGKEWRIMVLPDDLHALDTAYHDMIETGKATVEVRSVKKSGAIFYTQITMISHYDDAGVFRGHHCFMKDISKRKKAEQQRELLIDRLTDSNEELERFAFVCSHDLQEPLRMIRSFSERLEMHLKDDLKNDEKGRRYLHFVTDGAERSQALIRDILSYSSLDSEANKLELVDLNVLVKNVQTNMISSNNGNSGSISWSHLPCVKGNKTQLYQLFQNLINNGLKYQKTDAQAHVSIEAIDRGRDWEISIRDNGIGIADKHLKKIFEVFQRLHRKNEYAGTGVGLSICRKVVERHGGKIWVESQVEHGTTFFFSVPKEENLNHQNQKMETTYEF